MIGHISKLAGTPEDLGHLLCRPALPVLTVATTVPGRFSGDYASGSSFSGVQVRRCDEGEPLSGHDLEALQHAVADCPVFSICFARVGQFASSILFLEPTPDAALRALMQSIWATFPDTPPYAGAFTEPTVHLTIAKATSQVAFERLQSEISAAMVALLPLTLPVEEIVVMEEGVTGFWQNRAVMRLRREEVFSCVEGERAAHPQRG